MGNRGPLPKSGESREYEGGAAHRPMPHPSRPADFTSPAPEKPKGMPAAARRFWDFYVKQMALNGTLRQIDGPNLEVVCNLTADLQQLEREKRRLIRQRKAQAKTEKRVIMGGAMVEFEMTVEGRRLMQTLSATRSQLRSQCDRYGLNPMAGSRLQSGESIAPSRSAQQAEVSEIESLIQ